MKERPILFSAPMVRAILEGRKTQTRRVVKPQSFERHGQTFHPNEQWVCPYGKPGDRLWVREAWKYNGWCPAHAKGIKGGGMVVGVTYNADGAEIDRVRHGFDADQHLSGRPSIHMPRWASRIDLEITEVRVERLQDISEEDARAEGAMLAYAGDGKNSHAAGFKNLWQSINGADSWDANPWVWVVEFKQEVKA